MTNDAKKIYHFLVATRATSPELAISRRSLASAIDRIIGDGVDLATCRRFYSAWRLLLRMGIAHVDGNRVWVS